MNGIFFILMSGCPWRDLPERCGPYTTCCNRWSKDGTWASIMSKIQELAGPDGGGLTPGEAAVAGKAGGIAAVPSKANRKTPRELDREAYAGRNRIERFFGKIKEFRRVATRYETRARNYLSAVMLAVTRYPLRNLAGHLIESTA